MSQSLRFASKRSTVGAGVRWTLRGISAVVEIGMLFTGVSVITASDRGDDQLGAMLGWDLLAFFYLALGLLGIWLTSKHDIAGISGISSSDLPDEDVDVAAMSQAEHHPALRRLLGLYWGLLPVVFSLLGLTAALSIVFLKKSTDGLTVDMTKIAGTIAMVLAWLLLHVSYARRYQWFYRRDRGGLEFPGDSPLVTEVDFLYFAMTLGSSFATSDVNVTTTRMRWHVLGHSVLSFFYNAIVLAVAFRILTGG